MTSILRVVATGAVVVDEGGGVGHVRRRRVVGETSRKETSGDELGGVSLSIEVVVGFVFRVVEEEDALVEVVAASVVDVVVESSRSSGSVVVVVEADAPAPATEIFLVLMLFDIFSSPETFASTCTQ